MPTGNQSAIPATVEAAGNVSAQRRCGAALRRLLPRPETLLLLIALGWTAAAKVDAVADYRPSNLLASTAAMLVSDLIFFALVGLAFVGLDAALPQRVAARLTLLTAALVLIWSLLSSAWLIATGVQLQPGVLGVLLAEPAGFMPVVVAHLKQRLAEAIPLGITVLAALVWFTWRLIRPLPRHALPAAGGLRRGGLLGAALVPLAVATSLGLPAHGLGYGGDVLGFSSHWFAMRQMARGSRDKLDVVATSRRLPRAGERVVGLPQDAPGTPPNVVVLLLESVSFDATSLAGPGRGTTPTLARLATEGVEFRTTRVPVPLTSKAFWSTLTGSTPDLQPDYAEAVLADEPYESLASILRRAGYRSGFFQMSHGAFECAPGMFANLDFDWAWFFENLEDPAAEVGYLSGDDFRMIQPALDWAQREDGPFLLAMITSVAHDPYTVPDRCGPDPEDRYERYLNAVRCTDAFVAEICGELAARGLEDDTVLCVLGDHGEDFREDFHASRWAPVEQVIRIPWILRWPGHLRADLQVKWPCSQLDVTPTLLSILGFDISDAGFDGIDALDLSPSDRRHYFAGWYPNSPRGYVEGSRKLVYWPYNGSLFQYDLLRDPDERDPTPVEDPRRRAIIEEIEQWRSDSQLLIPAKRFRERFVYDHWHTFSSGRSCWAYYVP